MSLIRSNDPDYRVCLVGFEVLERLQVQAEEHGWSTRWSSVEALRSQMNEGPVLVQSFMREQKAGEVRVLRCLVLAPVSGEGAAGGLATLDVDPHELASLERIDRDPDVRSALTQVFALASGGIGMLSKK